MTNHGRMAMTLKPKRFATIEETKEKSKQELLALPKNENWKYHWHKFIISEEVTSKGTR